MLGYGEYAKYIKPNVHGFPKAVNILNFAPSHTINIILLIGQANGCRLLASPMSGFYFTFLNIIT